MWGATRFTQVLQAPVVKFQFTHPVWGATRIRRTLKTHRQFQFTHPVWGATHSRSPGRAPYGCFNSRTPCGVRLHEATAPARALRFNSRTPCGVRRGYGDGQADGLRFNSRTPCGVRPLEYLILLYSMWVSIHAPRVGCDITISKRPKPNTSFNSRTPCGVRPFHASSNLRMPLFQFTHPVWGATSPLLRWGA